MCDHSLPPSLLREEQPFLTVGCLLGTCSLLQVVSCQIDFFWRFATKVWREFSTLLEWVVLILQVDWGPRKKAVARLCLCGAGSEPWSDLHFRFLFAYFVFAPLENLCLHLSVVFVYLKSKPFLTLQLCVHWGCKVTCVAPLYTHQVESRI